MSALLIPVLALAVAGLVALVVVTAVLVHRRHRADPTYADRHLPDAPVDDHGQQEVSGHYLPRSSDSTGNFPATER